MEECIGEVKLNLGCGRVRWPEWVNVDTLEGSDLQCDITKLPYADGTVDAIAAIHVIEHFYAWEAPSVLAHWHNMLKPDGELILELPCMDKVFDYMRKCMDAKVPMSPAMTIFAFWGDPKYETVAMCHKWGYTRQSIQDLLLKVGFKRVEIQKPMYHFEMRDMRVIAHK